MEQVYGFFKNDFAINIKIFGVDNSSQNFAWVCIMLPIIVICLLMENKPLSLKPTIKISNI